MSQSHGFAPFGSRGNGFGPIGERLLDRGPARTQDQIAEALATAHATTLAVAEVVAVDFRRDEEEDVDFAPVAENVM